MIQSVQRASRILLAVAQADQGLTASEVAASMGLPVPTAYHLLATLEHERLLFKDAGKRYVLGAAVADIANAPGLRARIEPRHRQALAQLAHTTQETAYLTGWFRGEIRILATIEGSQAVRVAGLEVGRTGDVHARASAKVLLAFAEEEVRTSILDGLDFTRLTPVTVPDRAAFELQMAGIRQAGIVYDRGEFREDVRSVSAPIRSEGRVVAALAVLAPAGRYERTEPALVAALLSAVALAEGPPGGSTAL
ncbi:IclR family transcriptional regulator [Microbacterium sp.]|uniref:IclR family transcriptional regulator n=1 Tax=Microbacterium sp. TaxID=51671 RepID=UPI002D7EEF57|nr:IclR family transcriptional regulator C-terminal domain-containing protein [Microbacterium sp.]